MNERYDEEKFLGYLEGDLSREEMIEFEKQAADDPRLRNLIAQLVLDRHRLRNLPDEEPPADLMERVNQRLERNMLLGVAPSDPGFVAPVRRYRFKRVAGYLAVAALLAISTLLIVNTLSNDGLDRLAQSPGPLASNTPHASEPPTFRQPPAGPVNESKETSADRLAMAAEKTKREEGSGAAAADSEVPADTNAKANVETEIAADAEKRLALHNDKDGSEGVVGHLKAESSPARSPAPGTSLSKGQTESRFKAAEPADAAKSASKGEAVTAPPVQTLAEKQDQAMAAGQESPRATAAGGGGVASKLPAVPSLPRERKDESAANGSETDRTPLLLEVSSTSTEQTNQAIALWSAQNNVRMEMISRSQMAVEDQSRQADQKAGSDENQTQKQASNEIVLLLHRKQLAPLMTHLNSQKGQRASLTLLQSLGDHAGRDRAGTQSISQTQPASASQEKEKHAAGQAAATGGKQAMQNLAATQPARSNAELSTSGGYAELEPDTSLLDDEMIRLPVVVHEDAEAAQPNH